ncbi:MAG: DNA polymerase III subunit beta [Lachnospiraceae bacterium]|nr:DNA polymerase III subunit beta [Lachnospiraceae bacterium]
MLHLNLSKTGLITAVNIAMKAVPAKTSLPILECFLLRSAGGTVTLTANDMEMAICTRVSNASGEEGTIAVGAKLFSEIIRKLPEEEVELSADENDQITIVSGKAKFTIAGKDGADFVDMPSMETGNPVVISQFTLREIINQTIFSTAPNESNKMMTGELFEINGSRLRVAALDGHRIAIRNCDLTDTYPRFSVIVPGKTLGDISRIVTGGTDDFAELYFSRNHIQFRFDDTVVMSRLIEGEYFRINQMVSDNYEVKMVINRREFLDCIERSVLLIRENDKKPLVIDIKDGYASLSLNSIIGSLHEEIAIEKEGKDLTIGFNPRFLIDALRAVNDEDITFYMSNSRAPGFIRDAESSYIYLILPVNFIR